MPVGVARAVSLGLNGIGGGGWSVAPMVGASWSPVTGVSTAAGLEVGKTLGGNSEAFLQGWRDNASGAVTGVAGLRWRF